jgi:hypothetical protein
MVGLSHLSPPQLLGRGWRWLQPVMMFDNAARVELIP